MKTHFCLVCAGVLLACHWVGANVADEASLHGGPAELYVQVSSSDPHYFQLSDGSPYIPIGLNMAGPGYDSSMLVEAQTQLMESWMRSLAKNRGNFIRLWLGHEYFDVETVQPGHYDEQRFQRTEQFLRLARELGIRVKLCMENFRRIEPKSAPTYHSTSNKPLYHVTQGGVWTGMADFLVSDSGRVQFRKKMDWYRARLGDNPTIFAWELWNEMDAVATANMEWMDWTEEMIATLRTKFPQNLVTQSLGSYDKPWKYDRYRWLAELEKNDIVQIHRYLDLGAELEECRGPMDVIAAGAIATMRAFGGRKPILLAETGGVQPRHTGPIELHGRDHDGIILHDVLFAPFFAGSAGPGHIWFWDRYVDPNGLWYHFDRFAEAVEGIDPAKERFVPQLIVTDRLRVYVLDGRQTDLIWCRDTTNNWETELRNGIAPQPVIGASLDLFAYVGADADVKVEFYNPWTNQWQNGSCVDRRIALPEFTRSLVVRITKKVAG